MSNIGVAELVVMVLAGFMAFGIPIAILVLVILIYRNTRK